LNSSKLKFFIFDYKVHSSLISSFLKSSSIAHNHYKVKTHDWFNWKFRDNPFGETVLACVKDNGKIVGCVAYGIQPFKLDVEKINGVISFETFVHPDYQGRGIFNQLLQLAEKEVRKREIDLMVNFPNSNSLKGFLKSGWRQIDSPEYWIKGKSLTTIPLAFKDIRKGFKPLPSNLESLSAPVNLQQLSDSKLNSVITANYLKWRFFSVPVSEYVIIKNINYYSVLRLGKRGNIREAQVLLVNIQDEEVFSFSDFIKECKLKAKYDIISFSISKHNPIRKYLKKALFFKVPNSTNICYKILNPEIIRDEDVEKLSLSAINYHTY